MKNCRAYTKIKNKLKINRPTYRLRKIKIVRVPNTIQSVDRQSQGVDVLQMLYRTFGEG